MPDLSNQQLLDAMTVMLGSITDNMLTKEDAKGFATKDDLKSFATKDDLSKMEARLTRKIDSNRSVNVRHHLETRKMIGDLNRKYDHLREGLAKAGEAV